MPTLIEGSRLHLGAMIALVVVIVAAVMLRRTIKGFEIRVVGAAPKAARYSDYRDLFDDLGDTLDAVVVATPDHSHAPATMRALRSDLHCYTEKPLAHSIQEARALAEEVRDDGLQVNAVCPGSVDTAMLQQGVPGAQPDMTPDDVAEVVLFLLTAAPPALTGACLDVFG